MVFEEANQADNPARLSGVATQSIRSFKPFGFVDTETLYETSANIYLNNHEFTYKLNPKRRMNMELEVTKMELTMKDISGSSFKDVKAEGLDYDNVNLSKTKINNANMRGMTMNDINAAEITITNANLSGTSIQHANMSNMMIDHVHLFGTEFVNIVLPQESDGNYDPQGSYKPIKFNNCDLTNMEINNCNISGLKINGILIEELLNRK